MFDDRDNLLANRKAMKISKNIIAITLTIALLLVFGYSEYSMSHVYADDELDNIESTESTETEGLEEIYSEPDTETIESDNSDEGGNFLPDMSDDSDVGVEGDEVSLDGLMDENSDVVVARIDYSYIIDVPVTPGSEESETSPEDDTEQSDGEEPEEGTEQPDSEEPEPETEQPEDATPEYVEKTVSDYVEFYSLQAAFEAVDETQAVINENSPKSFELKITLVENIAMSESFYNTENASVTLDLNGHQIVLSENATMDFGSGNIVLTDIQYNNITEGQEAVLGGIISDGDTVFVTNGDIEFDNGYYENSKENGVLVSHANDITFNKGYFLTNSGSIIAEAQNVSVTGGFFIYDVWDGFCVNGIVTCANEQALIKGQILVGETEMTGYMLGNPFYKVTSDEITTYHADFGDAWDMASLISARNAGETAIIELINDEVQGILISRSYVLKDGFDAEGNLVSPSIALSGITMKRAIGYKGNFITVMSGALLLNKCYLDGSMTFETEEEYEEERNKPDAEKAKSNSSILSVMGQGELILQNSSVKYNYAQPENGSTDPCAGVSMTENAMLYLNGIVQISDNYRYIEAASEQGEEISPIGACNLYEASDGQVCILGALRDVENKSNINVYHGNGVIPGLTTMGVADAEYVRSLNAGLGEGQEINFSETMEMFHSDEYSSLYLVYKSSNHSFYWDKETYYLPEAGVNRIEYLLLLMGLLLFIIITVPAVKEKTELSIIIGICGVTLVIMGSVVGVFHMTHESNISTETQFIISDIESRVDYSGIHETSVNTSKLDATYSTESTETVDNIGKLGLPNDGRNYFGIIEIPELNLKLPVLSEYTDANMKTTPCVYAGSISENNLVIVGHNYDSQLAILNDLEADAKVNIKLTLLDGSTYTYTSFAMESLNPDQVDEMISGKWDLTVFTCSYSGENRIAMRCNMDR